MPLTRCALLVNGSQCVKPLNHHGVCRALRDGTALPTATAPATASTDRGDSQKGGLANPAHPEPLAAPPANGKRPSAYYALIGAAPHCGPGDTPIARLFLGRILNALELHDWTQDERNRLRLLRDKWRRRAEGNDPRFQAVGTRAGRVAFDVEVAARAARRKRKG